MPYRKSQVRADITVGVGPGQQPIHLGICDVWSGGSGTSNSGSFTGARGTINLGGNKTRDAATAEYLCDEAFWALWKALDAGRGDLDVAISVVPVGDDGTPFAAGPVSLTGKLTTVPVPEGDFSSNEGNTIVLGFDLDADAA